MKFLEFSWKSFNGSTMPHFSGLIIRLIGGLSESVIIYFLSVLNLMCLGNIKSDLPLCLDSKDNLTNTRSNEIKARKALLAWFMV